MMRALRIAWKRHLHSRTVFWTVLIRKVFFLQECGVLMPGVFFTDFLVTEFVCPGDLWIAFLQSCSPLSVYTIALKSLFGYFKVVMCYL